MTAIEFHLANRNHALNWLRENTESSKDWEFHARVFIASTLAITENDLAPMSSDDMMGGVTDPLDNAIGMTLQDVRERNEAWETISGLFSKLVQAYYDGGDAPYVPDPQDDPLFSFAYLLRMANNVRTREGLEAEALRDCIAVRREAVSNGR